ncbi:MAG: FAD-dependent oxidoreductase [Pseudomonadota bacterium]
MAETADVAVIGGGIHGCSAALHLAEAGASVVLLEKDSVGRHASGVNAGGVRRLGRALEEIPLALAAAQDWRRIRALVDDDCGYRESRYLKVAFTEADLEAGRRRVDILRQQGFEHEEMVDRATLRALLPAVAPDALGALHVPGDGAAQPYRTVQAFRRRAEARGVRLREGRAVAAIARRGGAWVLETGRAGERVSAPVVVNAAGAWGGRMAALLGDRVPLEAHAPMLAVTQAVPRFTEAVIGVLGGALSLKQFANGTVLIGGGVRGRADPDSNATTLDMAGMARFLGTARRVFPHLSAARVNRAWGGIEGYTPDDLPVIGPGAAEGVVHAFGFSAHGFQLGPAAGRVVAALALGEAPPVAVDAFRADRFG